ncbi:MAG TPA: hypothetical protein DEB39_09795, partial [Planctomycetaceae bacterium]|nr:hypothetical protein [Planctomycetaceae bacterium]
MFEPDQYELLDFGEGRRLERFGPLILNRPCPAVEGTRKNDPALWNEIDAVFVPDSRDNYARDDDVRDNDARDRRTGTGHARGCWKSVLTDPPSRWMIGANMPTVPPFPLVFELKLTPFGHVGLFPEHALDWIKIGALLAAHPGARVLNLFAYTGGGTLAAA